MLPVNLEVLVPKPTNSSAMLNPEEKRLEQLKLRLTPAEAEAIRTAAARENQTLSAYVVNLHKRRRPPAALQQFDVLVEVDRHLAEIPNAVRALDADLGRLSGRLASFFTADSGRAMAHQAEINAALLAVKDLRAEVLPKLAALQAAVAGPRDELARILTAIVRQE